MRSKPPVGCAEMLRRAALPASRCTSAIIGCRIWLDLPGHAGAGGVRSRAISESPRTSIAATATSAVWNVTNRPWLTTFAPILISFSRGLVSDHGCAVFGIGSVRVKFPKLYARGMD
jgi:hypothetical protein